MTLFMVSNVQVKPEITAWWCATSSCTQRHSGGPGAYPRCHWVKAGCTPDSNSTHGYLTNTHTQRKPNLHSFKPWTIAGIPNGNSHRQRGDHLHTESTRHRNLMAKTWLIEHYIVKATLYSSIRPYKGRRLMFSWTYARSPHCLAPPPGRLPGGWPRTLAWWDESHGQQAPLARSLRVPQTPRQRWVPPHPVCRLYLAPHPSPPKGESCHWKRWITCRVKLRCWQESVWSCAVAGGRPKHSRLSSCHLKNKGLLRCSGGSTFGPQPDGKQQGPKKRN